MPVFSKVPLWFWETETIDVVVELDAGIDHYEAHDDIGKINKLTGGTKQFTVTNRHVQPNNYAGTITVYEVEKHIFGWEIDRHQVAVETFALLIEGDI